MKRKKLQVVIATTIMSTLVVSSVAPTIQVFAKTNDTNIVAKSQSEKRNVMYYGDWSIWGGQGNFYPKDIPADQLTHLNFAFMDFDANGDLVFTDKDAAVGAPVGQDGVQWGAPNAGILIALQELRTKNPNLKLGISVGGWSKSGDFSEVAASKEKRTNLINNLVRFVEYTNMDFVDLDWEFPGEVREPDLVDNKNDEGTPKARPEDKENYIVLLEELRAALDKKGVELSKTYELTVALPAPKAKVDLGIDIDRLFNVVDFANIMSYDMRGAWDSVSGHQTGLYPNSEEPLEGNNLSVDESVDYLISNGAEADKIVIGAAYYTRGWNKVEKGNNPKLPGLFGEAEKNAKDADQTPSYGAPNEAPLTVGDGGRRSGVWSYRSIEKLKASYPGLKEYWDDEAKAPYLYDETTGLFFTYDNVKSIEEKTKYVHENNLGGVIGWMASQDAPTTNGNKRDELTKATKEGLFGEEALKSHEITYSELDVTATINSYTNDWGADRKGYEITIKNNEKAEEGNNVLKEVERGAETIKSPKLYLKTDKALNRGDHMAGTVTYENGYTVVDLKSVWEGKNIEQGQSYTFKLSGDSEIESIDIAQRMSETGPDMYRQTIYGEKSPEVNQAPVLSGVTNKTIKVGEDFDKMAGVTATDKEDGDLTSKISVTGEVDTTKAGGYELTYKVCDSNGLETTAKRVITVEAVVAPPVEDSDFGVGQGIEWPAQVNAPFADMTAWNNGDFSVNGALNLKKIAKDTGVKFFNLGFIQATSGVSDGKVNWGWGGFSSLNEKNNDNTQYQGIKQGIKDVRALGGDVAISLGGLNGTAIWEVTSDVDVLYNTYKEIVTGYGLTKLDLDIEGSTATNKEKNIANAKAIKKIQDETGVEVVLTLAVLPSGLTKVQLDVLEAYLSQGVNVDLVNIMTMCYGNATLLPGENYGTASLRAVDSTKDQVKDYFKKYANIELTDAEAYRKIGTTVSVGFEGEAHPIFTKEWTDLVVDHAIEKGIGMTSMWSINRDSMAQSNKGIYAAYEHTNLFKKFGSNEELPDPEQNTAPTLSGVEDKTINIGDEFNSLTGVTANDKEDGDITSKIEVTGTVDTSKAGKYTLTYKVTDKDGVTTTKVRTITVKDSSIVEDTYDPTTIYYGGEIVIYNGEEYKAKWWTQGEAPDKSQAWEKIVKPNEDGNLEWYEGMVSTEGTRVVYNGKVYEAKWWTTSTPGSDDSWKLV
ncbi:MAG: glycosyl hydrolase family 18 protein [Clostridium sp.]